MRFHRLPVKDPRTVARDIPGICDILFPQLLPSIVKYLNRQADAFFECASISDNDIKKTSINAAMLFEIACARTEQILAGETNEDWNLCLNVALKRQSRFFDAELPDNLTAYDISVAKKTSQNLFMALRVFEQASGASIIISPEIPGFQWIAKGNGDYSIGDCLIEVKCTSKGFGSADYRQLLMYWLLSFAGSIENKTKEWKTGVLINPRLNKYIEIEFDELISISAAGRSKIEILQLFDSIVSDYSSKLSNC